MSSAMDLDWDLPPLELSDEDRAMLDLTADEIMKDHGVVQVDLDDPNEQLQPTYIPDYEYEVKPAHGLNQAELAALTEALNRFRRKHGTSREIVEYLLDSTILSEKNEFLRDELHGAIKRAVPHRTGSFLRLMEQVRHCFLPPCNDMPLTVGTKKIILLYYRELIMKSDWPALRRAVRSSLALPKDVRNCYVDKRSWVLLKRELRGMCRVDAGRRAPPSGCNWYAGEIAELEVLWHQQLLHHCKSFKRFDAHCAMYAADEETWWQIGATHSTRNASECREFWDATH
jgi:hypothetical protein